jgi:hypothetical protein
MSGRYVQFGCGRSGPKEWKNFDASPTLYFERIPLIGRLYTKNDTRFSKTVEYGDIVSGLPIENKTCDVIYCSHVLEHLSLENFRIALINSCSYLKSGGTFRLVLPDLEFSINRYNNDKSSSASLVFLRETLLGREVSPQGIRGFIVNYLGHSEHLWMWDYKSIRKELENVGFSNIRRCYYGDSKDKMIDKVEVKNRFENCLGVECKKN